MTKEVGLVMPDSHYNAGLQLQPPTMSQFVEIFPAAHLTSRTTRE